MIYRIKIDIFVDGEDTKAVFEEAKQDRRLVRSKVNILAGGLKSAPDYYKKATTPDVLIVEEVGDDKEMIEDLARLAEVCEPTTKVVIVGHLNDISLYRMLIQQGISEYLLYPINAVQVLETLDSILIDPDEPQVGKVIAFYGARGGVGASTIAQNTAWLLSQKRNDEVALIDTDLAYGTSALSF
ncbi:MAG: P-loop NTPase, partial [Alphaproteobacteria bacterium]|nr:P-loop NTPase [Alphaproteobacteria bacterium]